MQLKLPWWNQSRLEDYNEQPQKIPDLLAFGASIKEKQHHVFRLGCQNINGMKIGGTQLGAEELETMHLLGIDIFSMI